MLSVALLRRRRSAVEVTWWRLRRVPANKVRVSERFRPQSRGDSPVRGNPPGRDLLPVSVNGMSAMRSCVPRRSGLSGSARGTRLSSRATGSGRSSRGLAELRHERSVFRVELLSAGLIRRSTGRSEARRSRRSAEAGSTLGAVPASERGQRRSKTEQGKRAHLAICPAA